jgi:hypothetical protein
VTYPLSDHRRIRLQMTGFAANFHCHTPPVQGSCARGCVCLALIQKAPAKIRNQHVGKRSIGELQQGGFIRTVLQDINPLLQLNYLFVPIRQLLQKVLPLP